MNLKQQIDLLKTKREYISNCEDWRRIHGIIKNAVFIGNYLCDEYTYYQREHLIELAQDDRNFLFYYILSDSIYNLLWDFGGQDLDLLEEDCDQCLLAKEDLINIIDEYLGNET